MRWNHPGTIRLRSIFHETATGLHRAAPSAPIRPVRGRLTASLCQPSILLSCARPARKPPMCAVAWAPAVAGVWVWEITSRG